MIEIITLICAVVAAGAGIFAAIKASSPQQHNMGGEMRDLRQEVGSTLHQFQNTLANTLADKNRTQSDILNQISSQQKERLEKVTSELTAMRGTVENRLDVLRGENNAKLDEMRKTVDEKLQTALEKRLTESFQQVREQLESVHKGLGEMQTLASGVGDLKKVLSNVKTRGIFGEVVLSNILEQFLTPQQYKANAQMKPNVLERVEFAVRMPGRDEEMYIPIDSKFPMEDYARLVTASEGADGEAVQQCVAQLETTVRAFAKTIADKYINPPSTTDYAILFVPTESLYAELLRKPGLSEKIYRDHRVMLAGPTTLAALLNTLQMGHRSAAIEKRSGEVRQVLGAVRTEFEKFGGTVSTLEKQLNTALNTVEELGKRTRIMNKRVGGVDSLPGDESSQLLGLDQNFESDDENAVLQIGKKKA